MKAEDRSAGNAGMVDDTTDRAYGHATVSAEARETVMAKDRSPIDANIVDRVTVKVDGRVSVTAAARTTVPSEGRSAVNTNVVVHATVKAEERATVSGEARRTVMPEDRSAVDAYMVDRITVKADERSAVSAETRTTFMADDLSVGNPWARLARSGAPVHDIDGTRGGGRKHARALTRMDPEDATMEIASTKLWGVPDEMDRKVSDETSEINNNLNHYRRYASAIYRVCYGGRGYSRSRAASGTSEGEISCPRSC